MFCENCGKTVADTAVACPFCGQASGASPLPSAALVAAQSSKGVVGQQKRSLLSLAEKAVYFRLARGFSWFLLIIITLGIIVDAILLIPTLSQFVGESTSVGPKDLKQAIASPSSVRSDSDESETVLDPAALAQLDQAAYEVILLLPADSRNSGIVDSLRGQIRNLAAGLSNDRKNQLAILQELREGLREVPDAQRMQAINAYASLKGRRIQQDQARREAAQRMLGVYGAGLVSAIVLLTLVTMILVLLSIERNTREHVPV